MRVENKYIKTVVQGPSHFCGKAFFMGVLFRRILSSRGPGPS